ncbi:MAG: class I SAM-dependent methyltransferase [Porticoccaceae bacterium]|nr:class I SAM-dependent methyltransferase [Porticoccaceae bacterium]
MNEVLPSAAPAVTVIMPPLYCAPGFAEQGQQLARDSGGQFLGVWDSVKNIAEPLVMWLDDTGLSLRQTGRKAMGPVQCEFVAGEARHRRLYGGGKSQAIAKAVGIRDRQRPYVADLTAGMGGDACALAGLGCRVVMVERHPAVAELLADGLRRGNLAAGEEGGEVAALMARMSLVKTSATDWLLSLADAEFPDVIYLDPMFPERRKSAQVNKNMQIFQQLVGEDLDADGLLPLALTRARYRVVVKRPSHAPWLNGEKPAVTLAGKSVRFDIYPLKKMP